jgi:hypothetical protein
MTDHTDTEALTADEAAEVSAYEQSLEMKHRTACLAHLMERTAGDAGYIEGDEIEGIAQFAKDIAAKAAECHETIRTERRAGFEANRKTRLAGDDPVFAALEAYEAAATSMDKKSSHNDPNVWRTVLANFFESASIAMSAQPTTSAGAVALLRFMGEKGCAFGDFS